MGTAVCAECHSSFPFANGFSAGDNTNTSAASPTFFDALANSSIFANYEASVHNAPGATTKSVRGAATDVVTCEGCHGPGSQHFGTGPIPFYQPGIAQCEACHSSTTIAQNAFIDPDLFSATIHANTALNPDPFFGQGAVGTSQATSYETGQPEWADAGGTVPVTKDQHIQECSACHNYSTKAAHIAEGDLTDTPNVRCASCHDAHNPAPEDGQRNMVTSRSPTGQSYLQVNPEQNLNLKPQLVNNTPNNTVPTTTTPVMFGAKNLTPGAGTWIRPRLVYQFHVGGNAASTFQGFTQELPTSTNNASSPPSANYNAGDFLRLSSERLCAACHTKGSYQFGASTGPSGSVTALSSTHNEDVYSEYFWSAHADVNGNTAVAQQDTSFPNSLYGFGAWARFSLLQTGSMRPGYPYDMGGSEGQSGYSGEVDPNQPTVPGTVFPQLIGGLAPTSVLLKNDAGKTPQLPPLPANNGTNFLNVGPSKAFDGRPIDTTGFVPFPPAWDPSGPKRVGNDTAYCFRCHNGLGAIEYMKGAAWGVAIGDTDQAHILWGDSTATCITCHDPHQNGSGNGNATTLNVRQPALYSYNTEFTPGAAPSGGTLRGGTHLMMDLSEPPPNIGNNAVCLLCHQGRESGWTLWNKIRRSQNSTGTIATATTAPGVSGANFLYNSITFNTGTKTYPNTPIPALVLNTKPNTNGGNDYYVETWPSLDDHHLPGAALLYSKDAFEFTTAPDGTPLFYSNGIPDHQNGRASENVKGGCVGCHMDNELNDPLVGGHTWNMANPVTGAENVLKCRNCHAGVGDFHGITVPEDWAGNGSDTDTAYNNLGTLSDVYAGLQGQAGAVANTNGIPNVSVYSGGDPAVKVASNLANYPNQGKNLGGTGLLGRLNEALWDNGIYLCVKTASTSKGNFSAGSYYLVSKLGTSATSVSGWFPGAPSGVYWTPNLQIATFNMSLAINSGGSGIAQLAQSAYYVHNAYYAAQYMIDTIEHLPANPNCHNSLGYQNTGAGVNSTGFPQAFTRPGSPDNPTMLPPGGTEHAAIDYRNQVFSP